ncbi:MAG TPA: Dabb family protein [Pirellulaceae bacterium]|nr:Dabb family protein [Pirellulaceae bacterium]
MRAILFSAAAALAGAALVGIVASASTAAPEKENEKVLRHIVMYQFKPATTKEQVQEVIDAFAGLPKKIDAIVGFEHGANVSHEGKSEGFTHVFVVTFQDEAGRETYLKHPAHDEYVKVVRDKREKVVVFDYWAAR